MTRWHSVGPIRRKASPQELIDSVLEDREVWYKYRLGYCEGRPDHHGPCEYRSSAFYAVRTVARVALALAVVALPFVWWALVNYLAARV